MAVAVMEATIVLMFSKKRMTEEVFLCWVSDFWAELGQSLFFGNLSVMIFCLFGGRAPASYRLQ